MSSAPSPGIPERPEPEASALEAARGWGAAGEPGLPGPSRVLGSSGAGNEVLSILPYGARGRKPSAGPPRKKEASEAASPGESVASAGRRSCSGQRCLRAVEISPPRRYNSA